MPRATTVLKQKVQKNGAYNKRRIATRDLQESRGTVETNAIVVEILEYEDKNKSATP